MTSVHGKGVKRVLDEGVDDLMVISTDPYGTPTRNPNGDFVALEDAVKNYRAHKRSERAITYEHNDERIPVLFRSSVNYVIDLPDAQKVALFYYTSGGCSAFRINQVLMRRTFDPSQCAADEDDSSSGGESPGPVIEQGSGKPVVLQMYPTQQTLTEMLLNTYRDAPIIDQPFIVYRGHAGDMDSRIFSSASIVLKSAVGFVQHDRKKAYVHDHPTYECCVHVIFVLPGSRVLFLPNYMQGVTQFRESEVLFAPHMGFYTELVDAPFAPTHTSDGGQVFRVRYWTYEPYSSTQVSALNLDSVMHLNDTYVPRRAQRFSRSSVPSLLDSFAFREGLDSLRPVQQQHFGRMPKLVPFDTFWATYRKRHRDAREEDAILKYQKALALLKNNISASI